MPIRASLHLTPGVADPAVDPASNIMESELNARRIHVHTQKNTGCYVLGIHIDI